MMASQDQPIQDVTWDGQTAIVSVAGEIDFSRSPDLQRGLQEVVDRDPQRILIDLSDVAYMDSSGVASLVKLLSRTKKKDVTLRLAGLSEKVRSIFEITRLDGVFDIYDTLEDAKADN